VAWSSRPNGRSIRGNGEQLRYFRNRRQLTQEELADLAGLSVRVLAKAEAGAAVRPDTIELLAEALSDPKQVVFPEDLVCDPRTLALKFFRSYAIDERQLVARCQGILADDVIAIMAGDPAEIPFSGRYEGVDGMDRLWGQFFRTVWRPDKLMAAVPYVLAVEGNYVLSIAKEIADLPGMPSMGPQSLFNTLRFERGKIVHFETHFDTLAAAKQIQAWRDQQTR
jgi:transcriptional regulator with XRE-family HTH domain